MDWQSPQHTSTCNYSLNSNWKFICIIRQYAQKLTEIDCQPHRLVLLVSEDYASLWVVLEEVRHYNWNCRRKVAMRYIYDENCMRFGIEDPQKRSHTMLTSRWCWRRGWWHCVCIHHGCRLEIKWNQYFCTFLSEGYIYILVGIISQLLSRHDTSSSHWCLVCWDSPVDNKTMIMTKCTAFDHFAK